MVRHQWWREERRNPRTMYSEPPGWSILKRGQFDYELWRDDGEPGIPFAQNRDYQALMELADKVTHE